jgi:hypothetical protein
VTDPDPDPVPRTREQRLQDTRRRLEDDVDLWVATASPTGGVPYMVPLSFLWDGETLLIATPASSVTGRNLLASGQVRLGLGLVRDVVMVDGTAQPLPPAELTAEEGDAFAAKTGFDPRDLATPYLYFRIIPHRIQAWREANELATRTLMRDGRWLDRSRLN